ncbi:MAG: GntR family transcriptional regulator [Nocardioides sp.]|nr:GntR family transcriptional regulator [Nocardioides sp.]
MSQPADAWNQIPDLMERGSVRQHVTARLRDDIVHGRLRPGARLTEASLGSRYFVSRTPVRDALRTLEEEGLVATAGARRYVARLGRRGTEELFDLRAALEPRAAGRAAEAPDLTVLRDLVAVVSAGEHALARGDLDEVAVLNTRFHHGLVQASGSVVLRDAHEPLALRLTWAHPREAGAGLAEAWTEHRRILDAVVTGDVATATARAAAHVRACRTRYDVRSATTARLARPAPRGLRPLGPVVGR